MIVSYGYNVISVRIKGVVYFLLRHINNICGREVPDTMSKDKANFFIDVLIPAFISIVITGLIFLLASIFWITITDYEFSDFLLVLSRVLEKASSYSTLLAAFVATIFFQSYSLTKNQKSELEAKT